MWGWKLWSLSGRIKDPKNGMGLVWKVKGESQINTIDEYGEWLSSSGICVNMSLAVDVCFNQHLMYCREKTHRERSEHMEITETHIWCLMIAYDSPMHLVSITVTPKRK